MTVHMKAYYLHGRREKTKTESSVAAKKKPWDFRVFFSRPVNSKNKIRGFFFCATRVGSKVTRVKSIVFPRAGRPLLVPQEKVKRLKMTHNEKLQSRAG